MSEQDFKVKKGIVVTDNATVGGDLAVTGAITGDSASITGTVTAASFSGDGSGLTGVTSYVDSDFDSDFAAKSTDDLSEGSVNQYYTKTRVDSDIDAKFVANLQVKIEKQLQKLSTPAKSNSKVDNK